VLDILGNLGGQLSWGGMLLDQEVSALAELASQAAASVDGELASMLTAYAQAGDLPLGERVLAGRELVCALIERGLADREPLAGMVDAYLANDALMKAMALRPSRLAEISHG
jgi:hypothetical protein